MTEPQTVEEALEELRRLRRDLADLAGMRERVIHLAHAGGASLRTIGAAAGLGKDEVNAILGYVRPGRR